MNQKCLKTVFCIHAYMHKKWSFPLRIYSVNVIISAGNCGFGHIYWRNPSWKTSFFCAVTCGKENSQKSVGATLSVCLNKDSYFHFHFDMSEGVAEKVVFLLKMLFWHWSWSPCFHLWCFKGKTFITSWIIIY